MEYGLLGEKLGHSFSPFIHSQLADYVYELCELPTPDAVREFFRRREFRGVNVTIPYKKVALELCDEVDGAARTIGAVNTVINDNGRLKGYNTDYPGILYMAARIGVSFQDKVVLVLGTGGTCATVTAVARDAGAKEVLWASRSGRDGVLTYEQAAQRDDVQILFNASPAGMYPQNGTCLVDLAWFPRLEAVLDAVYNPLETELLRRARERGLPCSNGLPMLVAQGKLAAEYFLGHALPDAETERVLAALRADRANLVLIGMPSCGKTSLGKACARLLSKQFVDLDEQIERQAGRPIADILQPGREKPFRDLESQVAAAFAKGCGQVLSTGGGVVLREENVAALRQNSVIIYLDRPLDALIPGGGRPLSQTKAALADQLARRGPLYQAACHLRVENEGEFGAVAQAIKEAFYEVLNSQRP